jgi:hypothetical protein
MQVHTRMRTETSYGTLYPRSEPTMRYTVRTPEGELTFNSFGEVERAWLQGLVESDDEILEEGSTKWRKASTVPLLAQARRRGDAVWGGTQPAWIVIAIVLASAALYSIAKGHTWFGLIMAFGLALLLTRVTFRAFKRSRP